MNNYITDIDILDESKESFLVYAEEVLTDRAIPSAEDGLLSVHRKLIWTMENILKMSNKSKYKKSASIVGSTLASSYYHGDSACYGALCKLAQVYLMRYPLVDGDGNLGTQEGNGMEASSRYTNARPSKYADLMYTDYNKNVVPLKPTYNEEYMEPVVLPSLLPNAICNGREAIGIGFSHNSLPHNLSEVCDAIVAYLNNNDITIDEIMKIMPGPDFPLGGTVINTQDVKDAYSTGHSNTSLRVRGDYEIKGQDIIFTSIPYRTYRNKIKEQINKNIDELDKIIDDFRDESNVGTNRLVFHCKSGINPESAVEILFALTDLQTTLSYNMNFIVNGTPKLCSITALIKAYVTHQMNVMIAAASHDRDAAEARKHVLDGLIIALGDIDKAIELIRGSEDRTQAEYELTKYFAIDEIQAKAILDMKLAKLTKLDKKDLEKELKEKIEIIEECKKIQNDESYRVILLIKKIQKMKAQYGDKRRTQLLYNKIEKKTTKSEKNIITPEDCVVIMTKTGYIKRVPKTSFKTQTRNGKGVKNKENVIIGLVSTNTTDTLMLFSTKGKLYRVVVNDIMSGTNATKGVSINTLINMEADEHIIALTTVKNNHNKNYVVFITKNGIIKKTKVEEYQKNSKSKKGLIAIKLKENDSIQSIHFMNEENMIVATTQGMGIQFKTKEIRAIGRNSTGVKAINLNENDTVITGFPVKPHDTLLVLNTNGYGNRFRVSDLPIQGRGGKGVRFSSSDVAVVTPAADSEKLIVFGQPNSICISAKEVPIHSRDCKGVHILKGSSIITGAIL